MLVEIQFQVYNAVKPLVWWINNLRNNTVQSKIFPVHTHIYILKSKYVDSTCITFRK